MIIPTMRFKIAKTIIQSPVSGLPVRLQNLLAINPNENHKKLKNTKI
jgi:hypothetical protein